MPAQPFATRSAIAGRGPDMSFQPATPLGGIAGWAFLNRTLDRQSASFRDSAEVARETAYFRNNIGKVTSGADLVSDHRLLRVALGAFGLDSDIDKRFFVRKVLEEGTADPRSMANRLVDKRYAKLADAFSFDNPFGARTDRPQAMAAITSAFETRQFEIAVGNSDESLRLALGFRREIAALAETGGATGWYGLLGNIPVRKVLADGFGLPASFAGLDIDRQVATLQDRTARLYGSGDIAVFSDPARVEDTISRYLARTSANSSVTATGPAATALSLLQAGQSQSRGTASLEALFSALY